MAMTIPQIRSALIRIATGMAEEADMIVRLANATKRRSPTRRAPAQQVPITPAIRRKVRALVVANPRMPMREIGRLVGIDGGRVSEIVSGFRDKR